MSSNRMSLGKASRVLCVLAVAAALAAAGEARGDDPKPPAKGDDAVQKLLQARLQAAQDSYNFRLEQYRAGRLDIAQLEGAARRLFTAELELLDKKEDRVSACQKNLERCAMVKELAETRNKAGLGGAAEVADAEYDRLDAAILLEREKAR